MFTKKVHADVKKSTLKVQDLKKDSTTRLKHLKIVLENLDVEESRQFFEANFSHIYCIVYDSFIAAETNLRQRELTFHLVHKAHREELECVLQVLEKALIYLPELLGRRWQCHSLTRIMTKLLHPGNSWKLRRDAMRYFLLWYQALGDMAPNAIHAMFATLVPGFPSPFPGLGLDVLNKSATQVSSSHDNQGRVGPVEILPVFPPQSGEKQPENLPCFFLDALLEFLVTQFGRIEWRDKICRQHKSFMFLFERFKQYYLPHIFPEFSSTTSLYKPNLELPTLRKASGSPDDRRRFDPMASCQVAFIKWIANYTHATKKGEIGFATSIPANRCVPVSSHSQALSQLHSQAPTQPLHLSLQPHSSHLSAAQISQASLHLATHPSAQGYCLATNDETERSPGTELRRVSVSQAGISTSDAVSPDSNQSVSFSQSDSTLSEDPNQSAICLVREVLYSSRDNVNLIHEVYRQAFLLDMSQAAAVRRTIAVYKDWIQMKVDLPPFMLEPLDGHKQEDHNRTKNGNPSEILANDIGETHRQTRLRNDSYLGAIHRENLLVRAGLQNLLQVFITHAAHVFTLEVTSDFPVLLEEQVEACKRVLNIYRYMVMHTRMEARTWEQLLVVLLQVTSLILSRTPPKRKEETLGGKLAPAIFQTLIVTWIKANLNVVISTRLWDQFLTVLSSLTQWEELIKEWAKTLETLTRVLARHVYNLDLNDLPLDRLTEQKAKRRRGGAGGNLDNGIMGSYSVDNSARGSNSVSNVDSGRGNGALAPRRARDRPGTNAKPAQMHSHQEENDNGPSSFANSDTSTVMFPLTSRQGSHRKRTYSSGESALVRSSSETNVNLLKAGHHHHRPRTPRPESHSHTVVIPVLPPSVEVEVARILACADGRPCPPARLRKRRSRSMDSLRGTRGGSPLHLYESECATRSPSPAPSSGLESTSFKDSPMQIDMISADGACIDVDDGEGRVEQRSVMAGGAERGWLPDVAVVLWRRMLGALGDVNRLADPALHAQVFDYLVDLNETMVKIRLNQGVSPDNLNTPPLPDLVPPITIIAPWCFQALKLPESYQKGKLSACRLLCSMTITPHDIPLGRDHITQFYSVLHHGLIGTDQFIMNSLVKFCGPRFFSLQLPGFSLLLLDFIHAANTIVSTSDLRQTPRTEAMSILGALLCLTNNLSSFPVLQPNAVDYSIMSCVDAKDHIVNILLKCGKREPAGLARCIALSSLGIYLYQELSNPPNAKGQRFFHPKMPEAINVLLLALRFNHRTVGQVASDILLLLVDHVTILLDYFPDVPCHIVEVIASTLAQLTPQEGIQMSERDKRLLTSLLFCLGEWVMALPKEVLLSVRPSKSPSKEDQTSLLHKIFKVLIKISGGSSGGGINTIESYFKPDLLHEFDPSITLDNLKEGTSGGGVGGRRSSAMPPETYAHRQPCGVTVKLAAKMVLMHMLNHVGHFPMAIGAARLSSMVVEHDDVPGLSPDELSVQIFSAPNIQLLVLSSQRLLSLVELPTLAVPGGGVTAGLTTAQSQVRLLLRDLSGKSCWDASILYCSPEDSSDSSLKCWAPTSAGSGQTVFAPSSGTVLPRRPLSVPVQAKMDESLLASCLVSHTPPQHTLRHRPPHILPTSQNTAADMDNLDDLLQYIGHTSPECLESLDTPRNLPSAPPPPLFAELEQEVITCVLNQRFNEQEYLQKHNSHITMLGEWAQRPPHSPPASPFQHCRLLFSQLGFAGWERRSQLNLLSKNEKLLRELRNLDSQRCRETHKIAVIYVAEGQEDKNSVLSNTCGSQAYEEFIAGLAWEVELESHTGFLGGLQRNKSTGDTAPYYATSFLEVIFHVATRMPSSSQESLLQKTRHLGNDEVHIVWSEHTRDYRRGIIPTEFCDVLIVIYPLPNKLFRVQVTRKPEVPYFGPLFNEAIVDQRVLPGLVRATAISASRAMRSLLPFYQQHYEDRAKSLDTIVKNHKDATTYEEFTGHVFSPAPSSSTFYSGPNRTSGVPHNYPERDSSFTHSSQLAAALLDSHRHPSPRSSNAGLHDVPLRGGSEVDALHGISPRPLKKLPLKLNSRAAKGLGSSSLTPPDSPTSRKSK
ncbi:probable Rho GTPase-activating protein CG5521 isoform X3 [Thrips palmi]|uniref:Probable Rho GTPase-activating protein CG5521 isoform X3 n=1 Tax=Thrips palmi TaxID=161013 RepID=A0A6P8YLW1_THRPL|nr:probable Rho GTPase-activating protein CG5521 isoform X3 [Thrips palmi]